MKLKGGCITKRLSILVFAVTITASFAFALLALVFDAFVLFSKSNYLISYARIYQSPQISANITHESAAVTLSKDFKDTSFTAPELRLGRNESHLVASFSSKVPDTRNRTSHLVRFQKTGKNETEKKISESENGTHSGRNESRESLTTAAVPSSPFLSSEPKNVKEDTECNLFEGRWVYDRAYPLYSFRSCPFIDEAFNCEGNGRPDSNYMRWRWQPKGCDLPRFNASAMLEFLRGKRLVFAGDSINRNQWESLLCMLSEAVPDKKRVYEIHHRRIAKGKGSYSFIFKDYQCTIEFYVTHFLVQEGKARIGRKRKSSLHIDRVDKSSSKWKGADILIFNSGHWWSHTKLSKGNTYFQEGDQVYPYLDINTVLRKSFQTWASWLESNIDTRKTRVFFRGYSPAHFRGGQWDSGGGCNKETEPFFKDMTTNQPPEYTQIAEEVLRHMKSPVTFLNITTMTSFRKDGHPSVYGKRYVGNETVDSRSRIQDCSHWCLPGVPDAWNELLYALLLSKSG